MNNFNITITSIQVMKLVNQTYEFIASQFKMTDDDIVLVANTLADIIQKNKALKQ